MCSAVFSLQNWKSQLWLIDGRYKGHQNMVSELLKVGAPDDISPLFTFRMVGIAHHPRAASWPLRALLGLVFFPDWLRASRRNVFCSVRDCSDSGSTTSCCWYITPLVCFVLGKCNQSLQWFLCEEF